MDRQPLQDPASGPACPIPIADYPEIILSHGGGGRLMHQLLERIFLPAFRDPLLEARGDGAVFDLDPGPVPPRLAFTTDTYVVHPLFFPGGDIGSLAVHGTVNDLAMCGARPLFLSAGFVLEEGLPMESLLRVVESMRRAAREAEVRIVTGDTKVVDRGKGDGIFLNTAGIGSVAPGVRVGPDLVRPGDMVLLNGDIGRHGMAVMAVREGLTFESAIESDSAPLAGLVMEMLESGVEVHAMRDITRGGLASALNEIAAAARVRIRIREADVPVRGDVGSACEILGLDPLYVACEGRFVSFVAPADAERALGLMGRHPLGSGARIVGEVSEGDPARPEGAVTMEGRIGAIRIVDMLSGEQLPRIC